MSRSSCLTLLRIKRTRSSHVSQQSDREGAGKPDTVTDAAGNKWAHTYDLRGREVQTNDPDKGVAKTTYNDLDQITSTEDARGKKIFIGYDAFGRKTRNAKTRQPGRS
ncbi:hypothetical protein ACFFNX_10800 [Actinoallomurus acaciae]|uniref:YD repeat-containing protein n=1 Tax=Actinoallomurus acaciae TaxID=502577 RepID=A0ABV5YCB3_9ACTN